MLQKRPDDTGYSNVGSNWRANYATLTALLRKSSLSFAILLILPTFPVKMVYLIPVLRFELTTPSSLVLPITSRPGLPLLET